MTPGQHTIKDSGDVRGCAAELRHRGFALCKPDPTAKKPTYKGWSVASLEPDAFGPGDQIGILSGPLSDGNRPGHALIVIDLDSPEAVAMADSHLPPTAMSDGRAGKPRSHRYYLVPTESVPQWARSAAEQGAAAATKQKGHPGPFKKGFDHRDSGARVIDFIGTGGQVVCPPAVWASADGSRTEPREWTGGAPGEPAVVPFLELWQKTCELASACGAEIPNVIPREATRRPPTGNMFATPVHERARKYLAELPVSVSGQNGHGALFRAARALVWGFDLSPEESLSILQSDFNPACQPPWSDRELRHKVEDADRVPFSDPRGYLRDAPRPGRNDPKAVFPRGSVPHGNSGDCGDGFHKNADRPRPPEGGNSGDCGNGFRGEEGYGQPDPLPEMPPVPKFPLHLFPPSLAAYWRDAAQALNVPPDYIAVPAIALLGAAIGRSRVASVKRTYCEPPLHWCVVVAPPGRVKSPSLRAAQGPLAHFNQRWREEYKDLVSRYESDVAKWEAEFAKWKKNPDGDAPAKPQKPTIKQLVLDKFTTEALVRINAHNPRGVVLAQDELAALVTSLGQYKKGGDDKQTMLSFWAGAQVQKDREKDSESGRPPLFITHSFVAVAGMIQPDMLSTLRGDYGRDDFMNDGWADRFLCSYPDPLPLCGETWATVSEELEKAYAGVFERLIRLEMVTEADPATQQPRARPFLLPFSGEAQAEWQTFTDNIASQSNALDQNDSYVGVLSKLKHYGLRFAALFHCLWEADCGTDSNSISGETMRRAAAMVAYFEAHGRRCLGVGFADRKSRIAQRLISWMERQPLDRAGFNRTDAYRALKDRKDVKSSEALLPAFKMLIDYGYIFPLGRPENARPGPVPEAYRINPAWKRSNAKSGPTIPTDRQSSERSGSNSGDCGDGFRKSGSSTSPNSGHYCDEPVTTITTDKPQTDKCQSNSGNCGDGFQEREPAPAPEGADGGDEFEMTA